MLTTSSLSMKCKACASLCVSVCVSVTVTVLTLFLLCFVFLCSWCSLVHHYSQCDDYTDKELFYRMKAAAKALKCDGFADVHDNLSTSIHLTTDCALLDEMLNIVSVATAALQKSVPTAKLERSMTGLSEAQDYLKALEELELALLQKIEAIDVHGGVTAEIKALGNEGIATVETAEATPNVSPLPPTTVPTATATATATATSE